MCASLTDSCHVERVRVRSNYIAISNGPWNRRTREFRFLKTLFNLSAYNFIPSKFKSCRDKRSRIYRETCSHAFVRARASGSVSGHRIRRRPTRRCPSTRHRADLTLDEHTNLTRGNRSRLVTTSCRGKYSMWDEHARQLLWERSYNLRVMSDLIHIYEPVAGLYFVQ